LIEVLDLVVQATDGTDTDLLIAAILHDVVEDTPVSYEDVAAKFGERVAQIVRESSDDMSLPKAERRRARIAGMPLKSKEARLLKMADVISNLRAMAGLPMKQRREGSVIHVILELRPDRS
jgi:(p)ppGpp synthase/HD superfamily hydrolase